MEVTLQMQARGFLLAAIAGLLLGGLYDVFRIFRALFRCGKRALFVQDLLFMLAAGAFSYLTALAANWGVVRLYLLAGEAAGFALYFLTLGNLTRCAAVFLRKTAEAAARPFFLAARKFLAAFRQRKKIHDIPKNNLKPPPNVVYNWGKVLRRIASGRNGLRHEGRSKQKAEKE